MARAEGGGGGGARGKWKWRWKSMGSSSIGTGMGMGLGCSYKKITLIVCLLNIVVALYVLRSLYASLYIYSDSYSRPVKYTPDQIRKMEESVRIRREAEPVELIKWVKKLEKELSGEAMVVELPQHLRQSISEDIIQRLKALRSDANITEQSDAVESWRKQKLNETKHLIHDGGTLESPITRKEAEMLLRALESDWAVLSEEIGLWIPSEIVVKEHDDKPEGVEDDPEEDILPGRPVPQQCNAELHTDYDGAAVRWGLTFHKESAADCCQACLDQAKHARPGEKKCNIWVYCPSEMGCHSPDIYEHKNQECWLKYAENPKLNFKDKYPDSYRNSHPTAPLIVPWVSGFVSA